MCKNPDTDNLINCIGKTLNITREHKSCFRVANGVAVGVEQWWHHPMRLTHLRTTCLGPLTLTKFYQNYL